ncbi:kinesin-like protein KIF3A [Oscarella lobularis]|uniref:kinesin-like protein KIF3A n=1 Tax=Oscarella lobularis TaxID=121494 RepID=UPI0033131DA5
MATNAAPPIGPSVAVRMRPRLARERMWRLRAADRLLVDERSRCVVLHRNQHQPKELRFDYVFSHRTSQHKLYTSCQIPKQIKAILRGDVTRASIIAYGQSGSGKTYSLHGDDEYPAIIQHAACDLFKNIEYAKEAGSSTKYDVTLSFLQIVNDRLRDLLNTSTPSDLLHVRDATKDGGAHVDGLTTIPVKNADHVMHVLRGGTSKTSQQAIKASFQSTISHTVVTLNVTSTSTSTKSGAEVRTGQLQFVDLAGADTPPTGGGGSGAGAAARKSSLSLFTLGQVVLALSRTKSQDSSSGGGFIPFRNSVLTRILKDSLSSGRCQTLILVCISPLQSNLHETINSLKFAAMAKYRDVKFPGSGGVRRGERFLPEVKSGYDPASRISSAALSEHHQSIPGQMGPTSTTTEAAASAAFALPQPHVESSDPTSFENDDNRAMEPLVFAQAARSVGLDPGDYILYLADRSMKPEQFAEAARNSGMGLIQFARHTASARIHPMDFAKHYGLLHNSCPEDPTQAWAPYLWDTSMQELLDYAWSLEEGIPTQDRTVRGVPLSRVFSGADAAAFFLDALEGVDNVDDALRVGSKLLIMGIIRSVSGDGFYATPTRLYQFCYEDTISAQMRKETFLDDFPEATEQVRSGSAKSATCTLV